MEAEATFILLFVVATTVAIASRRLAVPYTVALVVTGLVLGGLQVLSPPHLTKELLFAVFLPGLLFEAAYHLEYGDFRRNLFAISSLAVPGVVAAIGLTAVILTPVADGLDLVGGGFTWTDGLVFGALIAATDPIAVVALFKSLGAPRGLGVLVEGESLLNDGTAVVLFTLILGVALGDALDVPDLLVEFVVVVGAGAGVGAAIGLTVAEVMKRIDDPMIEITLTTIAAYGSFVAAEHLHVSGVIATVTAGMLCGNYAATRGMSASTRISVESFWEYVAFALNSIVFLLIGFEVRIPALLASWLPILAAYLAVVLARALVVGGVSGVLAVRGRGVPARWAVVLGWGGLRGGISMVLALSLPRDFPHRDLLVTMTFGVVILVLLVHGLTMAPLLRRLGLTARHEAREAFERARGELQLANRGAAELGRMRRSRFTDPEILAPLEREYEARVADAQARLRSLHIEHDQLREEETGRARRRLLFVEKRQIIESYREGLFDDAVQERLLADVDARMARLESDVAADGEEG